MSTPASSPPPLKNTLLVGSAWMVGLRWVLRFLGVVNIAIIARLLTPDDFGVVAMATAIVGLSKVFFELGVDYALIRKVNAEDSHFNSAWTIRLIQSILLAIVLVAVAPYAQIHFNDERVTLILYVLAISVIVQGCTNIGVISFRKDLEFGKEFRFLAVSKLLSVIATVSLAFLWRSYWALVIGILFQATIECILSYVFHSFRPRLSLAKGREIWSFSKWMIVLQISSYFAINFDRFLLGNLVTAAKLGQYAIGVEIAQLVTRNLVAPVSRAITPGLAKLQTEPERLRKAFLKTLGATSILVVPAAIGVAMVAEELVPLALGENWDEAIPITRAACVYLLISTLGSGALNLSMVAGQISNLAMLSLVRAILFVLCFYPVYEAFSLVGIIYGKAILELFYLLAVLVLVSKSHSVRLTAMFDQIWRAMISGGIMAAALWALSDVLIGNSIYLLVMKVLIGAIVYAGSIVALWRLFGGNEAIEDEIYGLISTKLLK